MKRQPAFSSLLACLLFALLALAGCQKSSQPLEVTGVFPAGGAKEVPYNSAVEITFSEAPAKLDDWFTVSPAIEGSFRYMDNAVAFVPSGAGGGGWQCNTTYTVTLKAGLPAAQGKGTLAEDFVFSFTTQEGGYYPQEMGHRAETFLPRDYPVLDLRLGGKGSGGIAADEEFAVAVHRLENGERYLKELYRSIPNKLVRVDTDGLPQVLSFTQGAAEIIGTDYNGDADIVFPETLPEGWYVATVTSNYMKNQVQKLLQIQDTAVYTQLNAGQVLLWANSTKTGEPLSGGTLEFYKDPFASMTPELSVRGDENGLYLMDLPEIDQEQYTDGWPRGDHGYASLPLSITAPGGTVYYDLLTPYNYDREKSLSQNYYGFLYLDRPIYHQDDTVKFWGVARPRKDAPKLDKVEVGLYQDWGDEPTLQVEVLVNAGGVFTGEFTYRSLKSGWLSLEVRPAGMERTERTWYDYICEESASISQYKKPVYTGSIETDKLYYRPGETVKARVGVRLFDRTPAAGMDMKISTEDGQERSYTTDNEGQIDFTFPARVDRGDAWDQWSWYPWSYGIHARGDDASDVDLSFSEYIQVFPVSVMMEAKEERHDGQSDLVITANQIDFDKVPQNGQLIQDYESLRGEPAQARVTVSLHRVSYQKVELAPYYDRYTKKSIPRCTFNRKDEVERVFDRTVGADGRLVLQDILPDDLGERDYCYVEVSTETGGRQMTTLSLGDPWVLDPEERAGHFHTFQVRGETTQVDTAYYSYWGGTFNFGETVEYQVMDNGLPVAEGRVMTNILQKEVLGKPRLGGTQGELLCDEEKLPNFTLCGAYFDGIRIYPVKPFSLSVEEASRQLDLQVLPDKEDYRPGETARVTLRLAEDGKPVSGGQVCLGVVDEAIFAVQEQYLNMGWELYRSVFYDYPEVSCSYVQHGADPYYGDGGKGGGGDGDGVTLREKFEDTAAFLTGTTGADGTARFTVKLPDNLTEWRLTALALDSRTFWGQTKSQLYTTLPFRIDPILSRTFLSGDTIACTVRGFGRGIQTTDLVDYTATVEGYTEPLEVTAQAPAGETVPLVFQKLPAGEYAITVTARCGEYSDGVRVPFTVRDSALVFPIHKTVDLQNGIDPEIQPTHYPVEVRVYNEGQKSFMAAWSLLSQDNSGRADAALAMASVKEPMTAFFGAGYEHPDPDLSLVQVSLDDPDGKGYQGIRLYPYAEPDLAASAWTAVVTPELVDAGWLGAYLREMEPVAGTQRPAALMGLAALDQLNDSQKVYLQTRAQNSELSNLESIYLITALSYLDQQEAQKLYSQIIAPRYKEKQGALYLAENTAYKTTESTAGAMACAILTGAPDDAEKLMTYLAAHSRTIYGTMRGPCQLQAALYIQRFQLKDSDLPAVSYTLEGERKSQVLPRSGCLSFTLNEDAWAAFDPKAEGGPAIASLSYTGTPDQLEITDSPRITVTKTMDTPEEEKHLGGETTVIIKAELGPELPYGHYQLVEWVPSNMRLRKVSRNARDWFSYRTDEQLLTISFYYGPSTGRTFTFNYTASSVLDTECVLERTYVYNGETMECGRTEKGEFLPSDYYYLGVGYLFRKE